MKIKENANLVCKILFWWTYFNKYDKQIEGKLVLAIKQILYTG